MPKFARLPPIPVPDATGETSQTVKRPRAVRKKVPVAGESKTEAHPTPDIPAPAAAAATTKPLPSRPRVLVVHSDAALLRLVRESLEAFLECDVRTTSSALTAFDRILQEPYRLLLLDLHLSDLSGELLYDLISRAYPRVHPGSLTAPPVIWLGTPADQPRQDSLTREARTKALLLTPLNIQRLLNTAAALLPAKAASSSLGFPIG